MSANIPSMGEETRAFLEDVYASEYEEMRKLAYLKTGQNAHIVDPSQAAVEALVRAALKRDQLHGKTQVERRAWLKKILVNEVLGALRRAERRLRSAPDAAGIDPLERPTTAGPEERFETAESLAEMCRAMEGLSEKNREILALVYRGDLSQQLCADLLGMSYDAFRARLSHAKGKLRELLKHDL